jgi:hypothetical protein
LPQAIFGVGSPPWYHTCFATTLKSWGHMDSKGAHGLHGYPGIPWVPIDSMAALGDPRRGPAPDLGGPGAPRFLYACGARCILTYQGSPNIWDCIPYALRCTNILGCSPIGTNPHILGYPGLWGCLLAHSRGVCSTAVVQVSLSYENPLQLAMDYYDDEDDDGAPSFDG